MSDSRSSEHSSGPAGGDTHVVSQGECLYSIAEEHGLTWQKVWDDSDNRELRERRGNPGALLPGDRLVIPTREAGEVPGATAQRHRFERKHSPATLRLRIRAEGVPRAALACELTVDGFTSSGRTDSDGKVEFVIPPCASHARLAIVDRETRTEIELAIGHLDPWDTASGAQGRLRNLGYDPGPIDGILGPGTRSVVRAFQRARGLRITGDLDRTTLETLKEVYGA